MESGHLTAVTTADLLRRYAEERATGCLRLERSGMQARVYFRDGLVYAAAAPGARARLGDRLVGADIITEDELAAALAHQRSLDEPRRIGELLIEQGLIDRETMRSFVREQSIDSVAMTMEWHGGTWAFNPDEETSEDIPLDLSVENLVMEGARRLEEWEIIRARIGSVDAVVDFVASGDAELSLTPDEWAMLTRIDGQSSIAEIAEEAGYNEFEAARIIYGLLTAGIVALVELGEPGDEDAEEAGDAEPAAMTAGGEEAFDPASASGLFDELGLDTDSPEEPGPAEAPAEAPPAAEPAPARGPARAPTDRPSADEHSDTERNDEPAAVPPERTAPAGHGVSRNELMREFAALDEDAPPTPPPPPPPPRAGGGSQPGGAEPGSAAERRQDRPSERGSDKERDRGGDKRRGLFGRRRRG